MTGDNPERDPGKNRDPATLLRSILAELDGSGCRYALIHPGPTFEEAVASDVDIAFDRDPNEVLLPILQRVSEAYGADLVQRLHYDIPHGYYYIVRVDGRSFLHLDCLHDPIGINRYHLPTDFLLENVAGPLGRQTQEQRRAVYLLMKRAVKGSASPQQLEVLRGCFRDARDPLWFSVRDWFGVRGRELVDRLLRSDGSEDSSKVLAQLRQAAAGNFLRRHAPRYLLALPKSAIRKARRFLRPTGLFVVLYGPDGAGKSTVATIVRSELERAFRRTWRFHWRPGLLPKLSGRTKTSGESDAAPVPPPEVSKYRGIISFARFVYYWLDFVLGYWLVVYPRKARTTLIVGERYFPDVLVNPHRYGFTVPRCVMRLAARAVPSPDLLILLKDDPQVIHARKPELSPARIAEQIDAYVEEAKYWGGASEIITKEGPDAVARRVADLILDECACRTQARLGRGPEQWRGFPAASNVKVWFSEADSLANSLHLYHPYSRIGRFTRFAVGYLPRMAHRCLFSARPDAHLAKQLRALTHLIRQTLKDPSLKVSFSTGSPGPHRKLTAQATRDGTPIGYVKVATDASVSALLRQEAEMLGFLRGEKLGAAKVPEVMAVGRHKELSLLFLSSPPRPGTPRPLQADRIDGEFLSAMASLRAEILPVAQVLGQIDAETYLQRLEVACASAAELVRHATGAVSGLLGKDGVRVSACHGDYAPWNTLELEDGTLYVFDWEYGRQCAPALHDLFHRVLMPARLILAQGPGAAMDRLLDLPADPVLSPVIARAGVSRDQLPAYVLLYLLDQLARRAEEAPLGFLMDSVRYVLTRTGHVPRRRAVLVSAYACEPGRGSEPAVGWQTCLAISRDHEAWVITRKNNRPQIERALAAEPNAHLHFRYADLPRWMRFWKRGPRGIRLYYYLWQFAALYEAKALLRAVSFDLAHHVTFVNDLTFTFLALLPIPFVWGPIGSNMRPAGLTDGTLGLLKERARYYFKVFLRAVDPLFWLSATRAKLVIGINDRIGRRFPLSVLTPKKYVSHVAIGVERAMAVQNRGARQGGDLRVLSVGRLIPIKAFHLGLRAFAVLSKREPAATLTIVGEGPKRAELERLATNLGVREKVSFVPWLPRPEALSLMNQADVFLFPSFEVAGMVVLEAMAHGLPVVCLKGTGPAELITEDCGFAVRVGSMKETVGDLAAALRILLGDRSLRLQMGTAAQRLVHERYVWEERHKAIRRWYFAAGIEETALLPEKTAATSAGATK